MEKWSPDAEGHLYEYFAVVDFFLDWVSLPIQDQTVAEMSTVTPKTRENEKLFT